jgi:hypothetical protein
MKILASTSAAERISRVPSGQARLLAATSIAAQDRLAGAMTMAVIEAATATMDIVKAAGMVAVSKTIVAEMIATILL